MSHISLFTLVIDDYDRAIDWFRRHLRARPAAATAAP